MGGAVEEMIRKAEKKLGRKLRERFVNFCPYCMQQVIQIMPFTPELFEMIWDKAPGWGVYVPTRREIAEILDWRYVIHPICRRCAKKLEDPATRRVMEEAFEENLIAAMQSRHKTVVNASKLLENPPYSFMGQGLTFFTTVEGKMVVFAPKERKSRLFIEEVFRGEHTDGVKPVGVVFYSRVGGDWRFETVAEDRLGEELLRRFLRRLSSQPDARGGRPHGG